ncbi:unnamed protein product [Acanthoscelides obtectus]|uniref:Uncharacterized protein n=1 Tax=Acanthoscelides obtectus TaxID=200917 RepID=A0A9P0PP92_ACAOB|nr:unnamed protein product [Acanthoscelides obtectus]CAK1676991.1 hypothetical protein AOBTE_LOCUS31050 [Acanthoscelides obtectus]
MVSKDVTRLGTVLNTSKELLTLDALKISVLVLTDVSRPRLRNGAGKSKKRISFLGKHHEGVGIYIVLCRHDRPS